MTYLASLPNSDSSLVKGGVYAPVHLVGAHHDRKSLLGVPSLGSGQGVEHLVVDSGGVVDIHAVAVFAGVSNGTSVLFTDETTISDKSHEQVIKNMRLYVNEELSVCLGSALIL